MAADLKILGVDPGTRIAGVAVLDGSARLVFRRRLALKDDDPNLRLLKLYSAVDGLLERSLAAVLAIENPSHPRNARTAHLLGRAVGVCVLAACRRKLLVVEYRPAQIRSVMPEVVSRYRSCRAWSRDELVAVCAAFLALREIVRA